jgi:hypothetical protein
MTQKRSQHYLSLSNKNGAKRANLKFPITKQNRVLTSFRPVSSLGEQLGELDLIRVN